MHRLLVERHEADAINHSGGGQVERRAETVQDCRASGRGDFSRGRIDGIEGVPLPQLWRAVGVVEALDILDELNGRVDPRHSGAFLEGPSVADDEEIGTPAHFFVIKQLRQEFRADSRGVTLY